MRGLWIQDGEARLREDLPKPAPRAQEALLRVDCVGICGTDLQLLAGYAGFAGIPGHEFVGTVVAGPERWMGRRVVADINFGCGDCAPCRHGDPHHCSARRVLGIRDAGGALAEWTVAPVANLVEVPPSLPDEVAVFAEPVAAACRAVDQVGNAAGGPVAVLGAGRLGQLTARVLKARGLRCQIWGRSRVSLERAAAAGLDARPAAELAPGSVAALIDCTGEAGGLALALTALRPHGLLVLKSTYTAAASVDLAPVVVKELRVLGSRCGSLPQAVDLLRERLAPRDLIDERYPLRDAAEALEAAAAPGAQKILVFPRS